MQLYTSYKLKLTPPDKNQFLNLQTLTFVM